MKGFITIHDDTITVRFAPPWTPNAYQVFLQSKQLPESEIAYDWRSDSYTVKAPARFAWVFGLDAPKLDQGWLPLSQHLKDFQAFTAKVALEARRYAIWWTTGLGKTHLMWELARQITHRTGGRVLIIEPVNIIQQTLEIGGQWFGLEAERIRSRAHLKHWCTGSVPAIGIVNPEKFIPPKGEDQSIAEVKHLAGVLLDEASLLAAGGGKIKWALIKSCKGIEYKYTFTATPARNDTLDYASQGSFLEKIKHDGEVIWTYFQRDNAGEWKIKKHAEAAFYRFLSGWSMYMVDPVRYGFDDYLQGLPKPVMMEHRLALTAQQRDMITAIPDAKGQLSLFGGRARLPLQDRIKYGQLARGFIYGAGSKVERYVDSEKPHFVAELVQQEAAAGLQPLVWAIYDEESRIIERLLKHSGLDVHVLHGSIPKAKRPAIIERYRSGGADVLISKASMVGFGLNFQHCGSMVFSGFDDSFERQFQAIRRAYRYGQKRAVRVHIPYIPELEGVVWNNVQEKQARYDRDTRIMERNYIEAMQGALNAA